MRLARAGSQLGQALLNSAGLGFAEMHAAYSGLLVKLFFGMVASNATLVGLVLAVTKLV